MLCKFCLIGAVVVGSLILPAQADAGGGKYVYRGSGTKFHTNPGGKYVYPGYSAWGPGYSAWRGR
jgi:hypothetical protein